MREYQYTENGITYRIEASCYYDSPEPRWGYRGGWYCEEAYIVDCSDPENAREIPVEELEYIALELAENDARDALGEDAYHGL